MNNIHARRGLTLTDVLIVLAMIGLLAFGFLPALSDKAKEADNRIKCTTNLRTLGQAMFLYSNEDVRTGAFPRTLYAPDKSAEPKAYTKPEASNPFKDGPEANDVTAAMFLLLRTQDITSDVFICPSTAAKPFQTPKGQTVQNFANFKSQENLSYSYFNPYFSKAAANDGAKFNNSLISEVPVMADMNPGGDGLLKLEPSASPADLRKGNSPNHGFDGQNVLYADGHVDWAKTCFAGPSTEGVADNIFTYGGKGWDGKPRESGIIGSSTGAKDAILLPVWDPKMKHPEVESIPDWDMRKVIRRGSTTTQPSSRPSDPTTRPTTRPGLQ